MCTVRMIAPGAVVLLLAIALVRVETLRLNAFDVIKDCKQFNTAFGYNGTLNYIPISSFTHAVDQREFKYYLFGVLGPTGAVIRLSHSVYPYGTEVVEVVLGAYNNTKTIARHQHRKSTGEFENTDIVKMATPNLLSPFRPVMLMLKVWTNGRREVLHTGQQFPFISFMDARNITVNYMAFTKMDSNLIIFYDCPVQSG